MAKGIIKVEQIGRLNKIEGNYYFKHVSDSGLGIHISELTTGFALPQCSSFAEAKRFLKKQSEQKKEKAMMYAIKEVGINYPLNEILNC